MTSKKKTFKHCVNGCAAPPKKPSRVLCKKCLEELNKKMSAMLTAFAKVLPRHQGGGDGLAD